MNITPSSLKSGLIAALFLAHPLQLQAAPIPGNGDGTDGALEVLADGTVNLNGETISSDGTLDLATHADEKGVLNCTTVTIVAGATLRFARNALNTPVSLLATGAVVVNGTINVSGDGRLAGPGGFDGAPAPTPGLDPAAGFGPGGSPGGGASNQLAAHRAGAGGAIAYGTRFCIPPVGGCGTGGYFRFGAKAGAGGGGAILIASDTSISCDGQILAMGGITADGLGWASGGTIRLVAPIVSGGGLLNARAPTGHASGGRVRIDSYDSTGGLFSSGNSGNILGNSEFTRGSFVVARLPVTPALRIVSVNGEAIAAGSGAVTLDPFPYDTAETIDVVLEASNFGATVPVEVRIVPLHGAPTTFTGTIDNTAGGTAQGTIQVTLPANVPCTIEAWKR